MELVDGLWGEKINPCMTHLLLRKIKWLFLPINLNNAHPFIHLLFSHLIVGFSSHHFFLFLGEDIDLFITIFHDMLDKFGDAYYLFITGFLKVCEEIVEV